jgi:hypothetical protein
MQQVEITGPSGAMRKQSGQKPKREWAAAHRMVNPAGSSMQDTDITAPSHTQVQSEFGNVCIFT